MVSGTNGKDDGIPPEDLKNKEWIEPPVASKIVENGPPYVVPKNGQVDENGNGGTVDKAAKEAQLLASTSEAIALKVTEGKLELTYQEFLSPYQLKNRSRKTQSN